jgi:HAD superfamily phosphoserine phosphatase-like hydrolase
MVKTTRRKEKIAVFDIDGTIFRSSLLIEFMEALMLEKVIPRRVEKSWEKEYLAWLERRGTYQDYLDKVVWASRRYIRGVSQFKVWEIAKKVVAFRKSRVYRFTSDLVRELKSTHYLVAISGSPYDMVQPFCKEFGFDKAYGRIFEVDGKSRFTGKILYEDLIRDKKKILERTLFKEGFTLQGSVGVGDTETDIPFLKMVERAIAFNPNEKLYREARRRGWEIVVERKDVIYKMR